MSEDKRLATPQELAEILGVPVSWIYDRTRLGQSAIPHVKVGKYVRFDVYAVLQFLRDKQTPGNRLSCLIALLG